MHYTGQPLKRGEDPHLVTGNGSFVDDIQQVTLETMETPSPTNPPGVKGIGELPTVATPVAVANAVMDALSSVGVRHIDTPLTPEKIWRALHGAGGD